ncbi:DNA sulfur modification protein DndE [Chromobacterium haemolyticum]|uniref:DNA sulfur modification protein DndE n=1 Tax=Chromobacterium haemolyticum TaxID=394935 RepID=UPI00068E0374|nr:DNA sulfur modification protein DndE [Chromobacterium haemolyticum]
MIQIDRIRLTAAAKNQLITLKRKTGINHYNTLCRYALCMSIANPSNPPAENFDFNGGIDIDWRTFTGSNEALYLNLLLLRAEQDGITGDELQIRRILNGHLHRGLSFMTSMHEDDLIKSLTIQKR